MSVNADNSKFPGGITRRAAIYIMIAGHMDELARRGLATGKIILTKKSTPIFEALCEMEFKPTDEEAKAALNSIRSYFGNPE